MKISNFKYIITDIGGGWGYNHKLYGITPSGEVYTTEVFDKSTFNINSNIECELIGQLDSVELGLKEESELHYAVMDASDLTIFDVEDHFVIVHDAPNISHNNPDIYNRINDLLLKLYNEQKNKYDKSFVGEVSGKELKSYINTVTKGHPVHTTFHASYNKELVDKFKELIKNE